MNALRRIRDLLALARNPEGDGRDGLAIVFPHSRIPYDVVGGYVNLLDGTAVLFGNDDPEPCPFALRPDDDRAVVALLSPKASRKSREAGDGRVFLIGLVPHVKLSPGAAARYVARRTFHFVPDAL